MDSRTKNIIGKKFNRLLVLEYIGRRDLGTYWNCICDCGNYREASSANLRNGYTKSCGCLQKEVKERLERNKIDITGQKFNRLLAIKPAKERSISHSVLWECLCDCGNSTKASVTSLRTGHTKSCGCLLKQLKSNDLTNKRFGRLVATQPTKYRQSDYVIWLCKCDCGNITQVSAQNLASGSTQSCGCIACKGSVYLYAMRSMSTGFIKIGITSNTVKRKRAIEESIQDKMEILGYCLSTRNEENALHKQLKGHRAIHPNHPKGIEWYYPTEQVLLAVNNIKSK